MNVQLNHFPLVDLIIFTISSDDGRLFLGEITMIVFFIFITPYLDYLIYNN